MAVVNRKSSASNKRARKQQALASAIGVVVEHLEERRLLSLTNGGFESPDVGSGNYQDSPSDAGWTFYNAGIASNGADELNSMNASGGSQAAVLGSMGVLSQTFDFGGRGIYYVELHAASTSGASFQISIDGQGVGSTFNANSSEAGAITTPLFAIGDGAHSLQISGGSGLLIDDVSVTQVPFSAPSVGVSSEYLSTGMITISWPARADLETGTYGYNVERSLDGANFITLPTSSGPTLDAGNWSLQDTSTLPGTTYFYRVVGGFSAPGSYSGVELRSDLASITTPSGAVPSPVVTAKWSHDVDVEIPQGDPGAPFNLLRSTDGVNYANLGTFDTPVVHDTNALPSTTYYYRLQSQNYCDVGQMSNAAVVTTPRELLIHLGAGQTRVTQGGRSFVLDLDAAGNPTGSDLVGWDINWGDGGAVQHVSGAPHSVPHTYGAPGSYHVSAVLDWQSYHYPVGGLSFDTSFGGGMVRGSFGSSAGDSANAVATLPTGRVLVAGNAGGSFALSQFLADGTPDPQFGVNGLVTTSFGTGFTARGAAVIVTGGKYLVAGDVHSTASGYDFALARYNADGTLDDSFGIGGTVITNFASDARANAVAVQATGGIIVAGFTNGDFAIAHYHSDGSIDTSWGGGTGKLILNFGSPSEIAYGIGIAPDGKIVVTGRNTQDVVTIRLLASGTLDSSFGTGGKKILDLGWGDYTYAVAFAAGGKVVLAGESNAQFTLIRLNANGSLDSTFHGGNNAGGVVRVADLGTAYARTILVQANGDIVAGGGGEGYYDIVRLRPDGTRDTTFANGGLDRTFDGAPDGGYFSALGAYQLDGRLLAMGGVGTSFLMARYLAENSVTVLSSDALADGSFETPVVSGEWVTRYAGEAIGMWAVESGSVDQATSNLWQAADGLQSLDMSGNSAGVIYQDVQTVPGQSYKLRFAVAGNVYGGSETKGLAVTWDVAGAASPAVVASTTFSTAGVSATDMGWTYHEYTLTAAANVMRLRFVSLEDSAYGATLDDVTLTSTNAVVNGSFEQATGGAPANWSVDSNVVVQDGIAADGNRYAKLGNDTSTGALHQSVATYPSQKYRLSFSLGTLNGVGIGTKVWWNGELLDLPTPTGDSLSGSGILDWSQFAYTVTATSALTALKFEGSSDGVGGAAYLDNVQLLPLVTPPAPGNLRAHAFSGTRVDLHWQDNSAIETGFIIKSSIDGVNYAVVGHAGAGATNYSVVGLSPNTSYSFTVTASNDGSDADSATAGGGIESEPSNVARSMTLVDSVNTSNLVTVGTWHFNENGSAVSGQGALPTLLDGIGYRLTARSANYCNASYCSWSGCCGSGGMYGDPDYAPAVIEPATNYCETGCGATAAVYGDAEYAWTYDYGPDQDRMPQTDADTALRGTDVGLKINGGIRGSIANWGDYNGAHTYIRDVVGNGQTLGAYYADYDTSDDTGAIELTIQRITSSDTPLASPTTSGASVVTEGQNYTLTLNAGLASGVNSWSVDWGDGNVQNVTGIAQTPIQTVTHVFSDGAPNPSIVATATNASGSVDTAPRAIQIVPLAPSGLTTSSTSDSQIDLAWTNHSQLATAYSIERSPNVTTWTVVASVGSDQTSYQDQGLDEGTSYTYRLRATTDSRNSAYSNTSAATTRPTPATNLLAVAVSDSEIDLSWDDNSTTNTGYDVKRSTDGVNYCCTVNLTVDGSAYAATSLQANTTYYFKVFAKGAGGNAIRVAVAQETTLPAGPLPTVMTGLVAAVLSTHVDLEWDAADVNATALRLERRDGDAGTWETVTTLADNDTSYSDTSIDSNHTYAYRLTATNSYGESDPSEEASATSGLIAPSGLTAQADANGQVELSWTDNSENESSFKIWRFETIGGVQVKTLEGEAPASDGTGIVSFTVGNLDVGTSYSFSVSAATEDATSAEATSSSVTPSIKSVSATGAAETTFRNSYQLTLHRDGISGSLTWQVDWGDGSDTQAVTGTADSSGNLYASHTYQGPDESDTVTYTIQATAGNSTDTYIADNFTVTGNPSSGLTSLPSPLVKAGRAVRRQLVQAFEDVYNNIRYQAYYGFMKGPDATESTGRGNDWDQASLLKKKLEKILGYWGVTEGVNYVVGTITAPKRMVQDWLGVTTAAAVAQLLHGVSTSSDGTSYTFPHTWLQVSVPDYNWNAVYVDPSWKFRDLHPGRSDVWAQSGSFFDEGSFESQVAEPSPLEFFETQATNWIKHHTLAGKPDLVGRVALADVAYDGPIIAKHFTDLPGIAATGYTVSNSSTTLPTNSSYRINVQFNNQTLIQPLSLPDDIGNKPVTLAYATISGAVHAVLFYGQNMALDFGAVTGTFGTTDISLKLSLLKPGESAAAPASQYTFPRKLGDPIALMIDADQFSDRDIMVQQKALNDLAISDTTAHPVSMDQYQMQLIDLIASKYAHDFNAQRAAIEGLAGATRSQDVGFGLITGVGTAMRNEDADGNLENPFTFYDSSPSRKKGIATDLPKLLLGPTPVDGSNNSMIFRAEMMASSYLESAVLEETLNLESVSTVKAFQWAEHQTIAAPILHFHADSLTPLTSAEGVSISALFPNEPSAVASLFQGLIRDDINAGNDVIVPNSLVHIHDWNGAAWIRELVSGNVILYRGMMISSNGVNASGADNTTAVPTSTIAPAPATNEINSVLSTFEDSVNWATLLATRGDPVNLYTGGLYDDETDISLPNVAFPATFGRHYDSLNDADTGFGQGWTFSYGDYLTENPTDGSVIWTTAQGQNYDFNKVGNTSYTNPAGLFGTFAPNKKGFSYRGTDGTIYMFSSKDKGGNGRLLSIVDRLGNTLTMDYFDAASASPILKSVSFAPKAPSSEAKARTLFTLSMPKRHNSTGSRTVTDYAGRVWTYLLEYDSSNRRYLTSVQAPFSNKKGHSVAQLTTSYTYLDLNDDKPNLLHTIARKVGKKLRGAQTYEYYANRRAFSTTDATGETEYFSYDLFTSDVLKHGKQVHTRYAYHTDTSGHTTKVEFNDAGLITRTINPDRSRVEEAWDSTVKISNNDPKTGKYLLKYTTNEVGLTDFYNYDFNKGNVTTHLSNSWDFSPSSHGGSGHGIETTYKYDPKFNGVTTTTIDGLMPDSTQRQDQRISTNIYDFGNLTHTIDAVGNVTDFTYDADGLLRTTVAPNAHGGDATTQAQYTTTYAYDPNGSGQVSVVTHILPTDSGYASIDVQTTDYDALGNPHRVTDGTGRTVQNDFDLLNRKIDTIVDPGTGNLNLTTSYGYYDDLLTSVIDPTGRQTQYGYDAMGRHTTATYLPTGALTTTQYDNSGKAIASIDPLGRTTHYYYDDRNRPIQTIYDDGGFSRTRLDGLGRAVATFEPLNSVSNYGQDPVAITLSSYDREGFLADVTNNLANNVMDPARQKTTFDYDTLGEQTASHFFTHTTDATPYRTTKVYRDNIGRIRQSRSDDGTVISTDFDANGNPTTAAAYEVQGLAKQGRDFMNPKSVKLGSLPANLKHIVTTVYDIADRAVTVIDPLTNITKTEYDPANRVIAVTDPRGVATASSTDYKTRFEYDAAGRQSKVILPRVVEDPDHTDAITNTYYADGRLKTVTNANGKTTTFAYRDSTSGSNTYTYDPAYNATTNPNDYTLEHHDLAGQLASVQDRNGHLITFTYDARGRQLSVTLPAGENGIQPVTNYTYNAAGNLVKTIDHATGLQTDLTYDALHRVIVSSQTDTNIPKVLSRSTTTYLNNNVDTVTDGRDYKTSFAYDKAGRAIAAYVGQSRFADPQKTPTDVLWQKVYDSFGNLRTQTDYPDHNNAATKRVTTYTYDKDNRLLTTTEPDPDGAGPIPALTTTYVYDAIGNLTSASVPDGAAASTTINTYDARNRLKTTTTPDPDGAGSKTGGTTSYDYDPDGNVQHMTDPAGNFTTYAYDNRDRLQSESTHVYLDATHADVAVSRTYAYDNAGNLLSLIDRRGRTRNFAYDATNRLIDELWPDAPGPITKDLHFRYDTGGRLIWADSDYRSALDVTHDYKFAYDALGQLTRYRQGVGNEGTPSESASVTLDQTYDLNGNLFQQTAKIGSTPDFANTYAYDNLDQLTSIVQSAPGVRAKTVAFGVNQIGEMTSIDRRSNGTQVPGTFRTYGYDRAGALTSINYASGAEYTIGRDAKHRVTTLKKDGTATQNFSYFFDDQLKTAPGQTLDYDANFNRTSNSSLPGKDNRLTQDANFTYEYDAEGNLTKRVAKAAGADTTTFTYDDRNRLTGVTLHAQPGGQVKSLTYDYDAADRLIDKKVGNVVTESYAYDGSDVLFTFNSASMTSATLTSRYLYGPGEHQVLAEDTPGKNTAAGTPTRWYLPDYEGSTRKVADDAGHTISTLDYDAFGNVTNPPAPGAWQPAHQYTGQVFDVDTGLSYYGARWYDPRMGRFLNQDPALDGTNPYAYVRNDPMNYTDPSGMSRMGSGWDAGSYNAATYTVTANLLNGGFGTNSPPTLMSSAPGDASSVALSSPNVEQIGYSGNSFPKNQRVEGFGDAITASLLDGDLYRVRVITVPPVVNPDAGMLPTDQAATRWNVTGPPHWDWQLPINPEMKDFAADEEDLADAYQMEAQRRANKHYNLMAGIEFEDGPVKGAEYHQQARTYWQEQANKFNLIFHLPGNARPTGARFSDGKVYPMQPVMCVCPDPGMFGSSLRGVSGGAARWKTALRDGEIRTSVETKQARNFFKSNKETAIDAWEQREGRDWPTDKNSNNWPAHHPRALGNGGDPMIVEPQAPGLDPHNIPGADGLTDYQKWGARGTPARNANKK